jgi:VWFA-related protein
MEKPMHVQRLAAWTLRIVMPMAIATVVVTGQSQTQNPPATPQGQPGTTSQQPVFRGGNNYHSVDLRVYDSKHVFVPDLKPSDFEVLEDGVPQKVTNFIPIIGGRVMTAVASETRKAPPGMILPASKPRSDSSGRIFIIFIDDLHLLGEDTPQVRHVLEQIRDTIIKDNDLIGLVSSGYSSIATDLSYDYGHKRFTEAIDKTMGSGMSTKDILNAPETSQGPSGIRYNAHVAFSTAHDILEKAELVTDRRKSFIYVSNGYDFNPFQDARLQRDQDLYSQTGQSSDQQSGLDPTTGQTSNSSDPTGAVDPFSKVGNEFAEADLISEIADLIRSARRANVTFYCVDPRGLSAGPSIADNLSVEDWRNHIETSTSSLRALAEETGGFAIVNTNDFKTGLQRIDNETSDYYILGYNSTNPDPLKVLRKVTIRVTRPGVKDVLYTDSYTLKRVTSKRGK